ncbi:hypothetical protein [Gordonia sp. N1V]|uniref:hypothetical protein n=1 Tax=Gordonia sp. N1V TaxID=3034163 RepID=UPI0023E188BE|nr:hypothetical protein [Gordonia sp. N1V]MDF3285013.1 hypothetical protein [Gordonia sp. N1V]
MSAPTPRLGYLPATRGFARTLRDRDGVLRRTDGTAYSPDPGDPDVGAAYRLAGEQIPALDTAHKLLLDTLIAHPPGYPASEDLPLAVQIASAASEYTTIHERIEVEDPDDYDGGIRENLDAVGYHLDTLREALDLERAAAADAAARSQDATPAPQTPGAVAVAGSVLAPDTDGVMRWPDGTAHVPYPDHTTIDPYAAAYTQITALDAALDHAHRDLDHAHHEINDLALREQDLHLTLHTIIDGAAGTLGDHPAVYGHTDSAHIHQTAQTAATLLRAHTHIHATATPDPDVARLHAAATNLRDAITRTFDAVHDLRRAQPGAQPFDHHGVQEWPNSPAESPLWEDVAAHHKALHGVAENLDTVLDRVERPAPTDQRPATPSAGRAARPDTSLPPPAPAPEPPHRHPEL